VSWFEALVLGVVQGATEFLPVSSSGHLVVTQKLLGLAVEGVLFEVAVHVATLLSVLLVYRGRVRELGLGALRRDRGAWRYLGLLSLATLPAAAIGLGLEARIETMFERPWVSGAGFLATGCILWSSRWALRRQPNRQPGARDALLMGLAQAGALIPGVSRSGTTVVVGLWLGLEAREAAAFSFLMAVPAITGAAVLQVPALLEGAAGVSSGALLVGGVAAAVTGVLAIRTFLLFLRRQTFHHFAVYVWCLGLAFLAWLAFAA
jgi:undecaprenyl-diphosphatase